MPYTNISTTILPVSNSVGVTLNNLEGMPANFNTAGFNSGIE